MTKKQKTSPGRPIADQLVEQVDEALKEWGYVSAVNAVMLDLNPDNTAYSSRERRARKRLAEVLVVAAHVPLSAPTESASDYLDRLIEDRAKTMRWKTHGKKGKQ